LWRVSFTPVTILLVHFAALGGPVAGYLAMPRLGRMLILTPGNIARSRENGRGYFAKHALSDRFLLGLTLVLTVFRGF